MSLLSEWLHRTFPVLFPRPTPKPAPPITPPKPVPPVLPPVIPPIIPPIPPPPIVPPTPPLPSTPDDTTARALAAMNARRASKGLGPFAWDAGLATAAMELAVPLGKGQAQPHQDFPGRVRRNGWPFENMGIRNIGFGNTSEGISWGGRSPEDAVLILDNDPSPAEPHRRDFEDPQFDFVGIAIVPNGPGLLTMLAPGLPTMPRTLASAAVCGPDGNAIVPAHVVAIAALGGGYTSIGGLVAVVDYGSRRR